MSPNNAHLSWLDYSVVLVYVAAMVGIGFYFSRRQGGTDHYYAGGRRIPTWAIGISMLATIISSVTFISYPGRSYSSNWLFLVQGLMVPVVLLVIIWFIVPAYRHAIGISAYEYFEKRFSYAPRLYASLGFFVVTFTKMGSITYLMSLAIHGMTGWDIRTVIVVVGAATVLYTWIGGLEAVVWTDVVQGFLFLLGGLLCLAVLLFKPEGGPAAVISHAWQHDKISVRPYNIDFAKATLIVLAINGLFYAFQNYTTNQTIIQRFLAAKNDRAAIRATLTGVLLCVPTWMIFMFIGSCLWSFYQITQIPLPPTLTKADDVFPHFIVTQLPPGIAGMVLAALMAAAMSTLSSDLNCLSAVAVEDYYRRLRPNAADQTRLLVGKAVVVACGLISIAISLLYVRLGEDSILETIFNLYAIFSGGMAGLFALAFLTRRANRQGVLIGIITCIIFTAWTALTTPMKVGGPKPVLLLDLGKFNYPHHSLMVQVYSNLLMFLVGYAASLLFPHEGRHDELTIYGWLGGRQADVEATSP